MKCSVCDNEIPEGVLSCPVCGAEVELVPEYLSEDMQREKLKREREAEERLEKERLERREMRRRAHRMKPHIRVLLVIIALLISWILFSGAVYLLKLHEKTPYEGQSFTANETETVLDEDGVGRGTAPSD